MVCWLGFDDTNLDIPGNKESQLRNCLTSWPLSSFLIADWRKATVGRIRCLGYVKKISEQVSKQCSLVISSSVPASGFPPWAPALAFFFWWWIITWKPNKPFPPPDAFRHGVYHSKREANKDTWERGTVHQAIDAISSACRTKLFTQWNSKNACQFNFKVEVKRI